MMEGKDNAKKKEEENMESTMIRSKSISFSDFIKANREKIADITPKNPTISKDDEWRKEDGWDKEFKVKKNP